jgi:hypothetical protein
LTKPNTSLHNQHASVASLPRLFAFTGTPLGFPLESPFTFAGIPIWVSNYSLSDIRPVAVEAWLATLNHLANGSRAKVRNIMSAMYSHAMRWEFYDKNPITTVRQSAKQRRATDVFTVEELKALLRQSKESTA